MDKLKIYKASAGSGKTFKLTEEYLKLVFANPYAFKQILAVTFTNKATAEMKSRILQELYLLSNSDISNTNIKQSGHKDTLSNFFNLSDIEISKKARTILNNILHDYSKFSVNTIDKFFQQILRSFTKEIGIQPGYQIELNNDDILSKSIDELMHEIGDNKQLQEWLIKYSESKINEGKNWDFNRDLKSLGKQIFTEKYKEQNQDFIEKSDKDLFNKYLSTLNSIKYKFEEKLIKIGEEAIEYIFSNNLDISDFLSGKAGVINYFYKLSNKKFETPGKRVYDALGSVEKWYKKSSPKKEEITNAVNNKLLDLLKDAVNYFNNENINYNTATAILSNFYTLGILKDINRKIKEYSKLNNIFLLSDGAKLLNDIINNNDTPFIYEKTGNIYKHFLIDEFQDTSTMQWKNFKPLITNSLSQNKKNIIVGDIKQSIYRWRNSDWSILAHHVNNDFKQFLPKTESLEHNYRSQKNIISYNNTIFASAASILQNDFNYKILENKNISDDLKNEIITAYHDLYQKSPNNTKGGYICNKFYEDDDENTWKEKVKENIPKIIEQLQDKNYKLKDIAILVRTKNEGKEIADTIIEYKNRTNNNSYKYDFISNESLFLNNSASVNFIISIFRYFIFPENTINKAELIYRYNRQKDSEIENIHKLFNYKNKLQDYLPDDVFSRLDKLKNLPINELTEKIILLFNLNHEKTELPFLQAFQNVIFEFSKKNSSEINTFLEWWNENNNKQTLVVSDEQDAIKILTIHKSKGLEFKAVIIPFCVWDISKSRNDDILWCKTQKEPFNKIPLVPVTLTKKLENTIFDNTYYKETMYKYVDSLNMTYVAFTRAKNALYTFSKKPKDENKIPNIGDLLHFILTNTSYPKIPLNEKKPEFVEFNNYWDNENQKFELGNIQENISDKESSKNDIFYIENISLSELPSFDIKNRLNLKLHNPEYFNSENTNNKINYGKMMHEIFENIITDEDIPSAINEQFNEGKINLSEKEILIKKIYSTLKNEEIKNWFNNKWRVKTENEIILPNGKTFRPDRVIYNDNEMKIIDYKFGEIDELKHRKQITNYKNSLTEMGYKNIKAYIWYVEKNKIIED